MHNNLEIKVKINGNEISEERLISVGCIFVCNMHQIDTYYNVEKGRLKLRVIYDIHGELIYYERDETSIYKKSSYEKYWCENFKEFNELFSRVLGIKGIVDKQRRLFLYQSTRVHLDDVKDLGKFLEIEVPVESSSNDAQNMMNYLIEQLNVSKINFFKKSYIDLYYDIKGEVCNTKLHG